MKLRMAIALALTALVAAAAPKAALDTAKIEALTGATGKLDEQEGVFRVAVPRTDLEIEVNSVKLPATMGLTSWVGFKRAGTQTVMTGELALVQDQVNLVLDVVLDQKLEVTALHDHFFWDRPRLLFLSLSGAGDETQLATAVGKVFQKVKQTSGGNGQIPVISFDPAEGALDSKKIDAVLGKTGTLDGGVYKLSFPRTARIHGEPLGAAMGVGSWAAFSGTDDAAIVDGDLALLESELQGALKALRASGLYIVAIHQHFSGENPRLVSVHFWGVGPTAKLAGGIKAALDVQSRR